MKVLSIGGSGFLSGTLMREALATGHEVWAVTRGKKKLPGGIRHIRCDRKDTETLRTALARENTEWDLAVDCIGFEREDAAQDMELLPGFARHFVFISTDFVFDPQQRTFPQLSDNEHFDPKDSYGAKKRLCELEILDSPGKTGWTILRPCHIYGPGSLLGCLPKHGRDKDLLEKIRQGEPLRLVGGGHFLQQPIFAANLCRIILACAAHPGACGKILQIAGPEIIESRKYYEIIADIIGCEVNIEELAVDAYRQENPGQASFLCHRVYDLFPIAEAGLPVPHTRMREGLAAHVEWALTQS